MWVQALSDGVYKVSGWTKNDYDNNTTAIDDFQVIVKDGELEGCGNYIAGSNYNSAKQAWWTGTVRGKIVSITEKYGTHDMHFIYGGVVNTDTMVVDGNYKWEYNSAVGTFSFTFTRLSRLQAKGALEQLEQKMKGEIISEEAYDMRKKQLRLLLV